MRRTRHVVLPVRSWQYIGLLLVSLACVTFGLVARDREGQAGSLTGPELLHRAPHGVDVCPNLDPFKKSPACLDSLEKPDPVSKNNERRVIDSGTVRIDRKRSIDSSTSSMRRLPERRLSRSLERMDEKIRNVRSVNRESPNTEVQTYSRRLARDFTDRTRRLSKISTERSRSMDRREEREIERRALENRELRERRERFEVASRRTIGSRNIEKREIRLGNDRFRDTVRSIKEKRDSDRERVYDRRASSVERRELRLENRERIDDRRANSVERRESRLENRERANDRRINSVERRESRFANRERIDDRRANSVERRESRLENREKANVRRINSIDRRQSRLENRERANDRRINSLDRRQSRLENRERANDRRINSLDRRQSRLENRERTNDRRTNSVEGRQSRLENRERTNDLRTNSVERRQSRLENRERSNDRRTNSIERRESRLENRERRLTNERRESERRNSRLGTLNRERRSSSLDTERRNSRIDISNRERRASNVRTDRTRKTLEIRTTERQSESIRLTDRRDIERQNSRAEIRDVRSRSQERLDSENRREDRRKIEVLDRRSRSTDRLDSSRLNRERRFSLERRVSTERRASENLNRREDERFNRRTTDLQSHRLHDRRSQSLNRRTTNGLDRERQLSLERRISTVRETSENLNRREDERFNRRTTDLQSHRLNDRRSQSLNRRTTNELDRERRLNLERRILTERASKNLNRLENRRELSNRLSRGEIDRTTFSRSSESSDISEDRQEKRKIVLSRESLERRTTDRREIGTLKRTVRSIAVADKNSLRIARYSSDPSLARTRNEPTDRREQRLTKEKTNNDYRSRVNRDLNLSRQEKRLSRSSELLTRSNSMERRESLENRRTRTDNDRRSTVLSTERREIQQRGLITRTASSMLRTNDLRERRSSNARIQERFAGKIERNTNEQRRFTDLSSIGKIERLMELRSRDERRNVQSNLAGKRNLERRNSDSRIRYTDLEKDLKMIERSRDDTVRRSSQRRHVDLRQSGSLRDKIRTSELPARIRNTLIVPSIDRDRLNFARDRSLEKNRRLLDLDRRVRKITQDSRDDEYGRKIGLISGFLKTSALSNYDLTFEVIRQAFVISICIVYGLSMSKSKKLFTGNLMDRINLFALR